MITYMCTVKGCPTTTGIRIQEVKGITNLHLHFENISASVFIKFRVLIAKYIHTNYTYTHTHTHTHTCMCTFTVHTHTHSLTKDHTLLLVTYFQSVLVSVGCIFGMEYIDQAIRRPVLWKPSPSFNQRPAASTL
jgi:hypothetical protein